MAVLISKDRIDNYIEEAREVNDKAIAEEERRQLILSRLAKRKGYLDIYDTGLVYGTPECPRAKRL